MHSHHHRHRIHKDSNDLFDLPGLNLDGAD